MNRRRFFEMMLAAAATPPTYVFFGSLWKPQPEMIIAPFGTYPGLTLAEWAKRLPACPVDQVARLMAQTNEILRDMVFVPGPPGPLRVTIETKLPEVAEMADRL